MASTTHVHSQLRNRAVQLLETFFASDDEPVRRVIFHQAFSEIQPNPANRIEFGGSVAAFAAGSVDKLLTFGCAGPGRHSLSILLTTMASARGRQSHPDYHAIPRALDEDCAQSNGAPKIFISYRRDDSQGSARHLLDDLHTEFGRDNVFFDITTLKPGEDFVDAITRTLSECHTVLAIIGPRWLRLLDDSHRQADEPDYVRLEIETALGRKIKVVPVLVEGASMPKRGDLPDSLQDLARRHTIELSASRWSDDVGRLVESLRGPTTAATPGLPSRSEQHQYLDRLIEEIEAKARLYSSLSAIATKKPNLTALDPWSDDKALELLLRHQSRKHETQDPSPSRDYDDILSAFNDVKRAALLGDPGSGKSTTLRKLALELAHRALADPQAPLPLLVTLGNWTGDEPLSDFLAEQAPEIAWAAEALSKANKLILLLDGLNEVPTARRTAKASDIKRLCKKLEKLNPKTAIVASCRREDYVGDLDLGFDTLTLEPLSPQRIRTALRQWVSNGNQPPETADRLFWQLTGDARLSSVLKTWQIAGATEEAFWSVSDPRDEKQAYQKTSSEEDRLWLQHIPNPRSLLRLASNPFMLTMLFQVWLSEGELPKNRGDLFGRFVNRLLSREGLLVRDAETGEWHLTTGGEQLLSGLARLAWRMQTDRIAAGQSESGDFGVLTVVSSEIAVQALSSQALLKKALDSTLLEGADDLRFRHQLLQEYFTAVALRSNLDETRAEDLWPRPQWWQRTGWEETAVLLAGFYANDCSHIIRWLAHAQPEVAAQCVLESGADIANHSALLQELRSAWLPRLTDIQREPMPEARAAIGRALGYLNLDHRKGTGLRPDGLPDIEWVQIPGGEFLYQEGKGRKIKTFRMARYPVTNVQFQAFLDAKDGYSNDLWWNGLDNPDRTPQPSNWSEANHPRETVSWYEAMAFCAWLGHHLKLEISLPTEWQWERAARGIDGRVYPWGNEYQPGCANINETYQEGGTHRLNRTSAVGIYPQGASVEGVLDLSGNLWEWCLNEYDKPDRIQSGGEESRVLRGGSWSFDLDFARADARNYFHPHFRYNSFGFRVVVSSPIRNADR